MQLPEEVTRVILEGSSRSSKTYSIKQSAHETQTKESKDNITETQMIVKDIWDAIAAQQNIDGKTPSQIMIKKSVMDQILKENSIFMKANCNTGEYKGISHFELYGIPVTIYPDEDWQLVYEEPRSKQ